MEIWFHYGETHDCLSHFISVEKLGDGPKYKSIILNLDIHDAFQTKKKHSLRGNNTKLLHSIAPFAFLSQFSQVLDTQTWRKRLLQLVSLLCIKDAKCVEVLGATDLELNHILAPLDLHGACIFSPRSEKEVLDLVNLLRHFAGEMPIR